MDQHLTKIAKEIKKRVLSLKGSVIVVQLLGILSISL